MTLHTVVGFYGDCISRGAHDWGGWINTDGLFYGFGESIHKIFLFLFTFGVCLLLFWIYLLRSVCGWCCSNLAWTPCPWNKDKNYVDYLVRKLYNEICLLNCKLGAFCLPLQREDTPQSMISSKCAHSHPPSFCPLSQAFHHKFIHFITIVYVCVCRATGDWCAQIIFPSAIEPTHRRTCIRVLRIYVTIAYAPFRGACWGLNKKFYPI